MKIYFERKVLLLALLCFGMGARAGNVLSIGSVQGAPGKEVSLALALENADEVAALQVLIPLGEYLSYVEGSAAMTDRSNGHSVTAGMKDGTLNVMVYSMGMNPLKGNKGDIVTLRLKLGNHPTDVTLTATKVVMTDGSGNAISDAMSASGVVSIRCAKAEYSPMAIDFGLVPIRSTYSKSFTVRNSGNETLEVTGLQFMNYTTKFSCTTQFPLTVAPGSSASIKIEYAPEERGTVSEEVKVLCNSISKLNTIALKAQPFAVNELHVQPVSGTADETVTIPLTMNNMDAVSGFQIEFRLPDALEYVPNSFVLSERKQDHIVVASMDNRVLRIICYSPSDSPFTGEDGEIGSLQLVLRGRNSVNLKPSKCLLTATIDQQVANVCSAYYGSTIGIKSPRMSVSSSLVMGDTPVTEDAQEMLIVRNVGNAPLIISRVEFANDGFAVKEKMPLSIGAGSSKNLTVVYSSKEEGDYSTAMQIYSNDPELRLLKVSVKGNRFAPNYLSFETPDICTGNSLKVGVSLNNYDCISGIQFDVEYPSDYFEPTDELETTARAVGLSVARRLVGNDVTRYFFYSLTDEVVEAGEGKVFTFNFNQKEGTPPGDYQLNITNVKLGTPRMRDKYAGKDVVCTFCVTDYLLGDVNYDRRINGMDIVELVELIMGGQFDRAGDLYPSGSPDGLLTGMDLVEEVELVMSQTSANPAPALVARTERLAMRSERNGVKSLGIQSDRPFILAQMTVELSEGMTLSSITSDRRHVVAYRQTDDNKYVVVCYSNRNETFEANGKALEFHCLGDGDIKVSDVLLIDADKQECLGTDVQSDEATGINTIGDGQMTIDNADVYDLQGRKIEGSKVKGQGTKLQKGVYIINKQKVTIK